MAFDEICDPLTTHHIPAIDFYSLCVCIGGDKSNILNSRDGCSRDDFLLSCVVFLEKIIKAFIEQIAMGKSYEQTSHRGTVDLSHHNMLLFITCFCIANYRGTAMRWLHRYTNAE